MSLVSSKFKIIFPILSKNEDLYGIFQISIKKDVLSLKRDELIMILKSDNHFQESLLNAIKKIYDVNTIIIDDVEQTYDLSIKSKVILNLTSDNFNEFTPVNDLFSVGSLNYQNSTIKNCIILNHTINLDINDQNVSHENIGHSFFTSMKQVLNINLIYGSKINNSISRLI